MGNGAAAVSTSHSPLVGENTEKLVLPSPSKSDTRFVKGEATRVASKTNSPLERSPAIILFCPKNGYTAQLPSNELGSEFWTRSAPQTISHGSARSSRARSVSGGAKVGSKVSYCPTRMGSLGSLISNTCNPA